MTTAIFFDGQSARRHPVTLETTADGIVVAGDGVARVYPRARRAWPSRSSKPRRCCISTTAPAAR